jgi:peptidoglycan/xylan/chitin deacetylase (PgdA/CDA1 family)
MTAPRQKLFSFRWDIDHRACITDGLPRIMRVCREFGVANTFFVNMGRSTNLKEWLRGLAGSRAKLNDMQAIHLIRKIGWPRFVVETVLARPVGRSFIHALERTAADGHELGLHGASDHVVWSRRFDTLPEAVIAADLDQTLEDFTRLLGRPAGFTSPGFKSDERITRMVERFGFAYDGDAIGGSPHRPRYGEQQARHWRIPVTICGPRTVPFLEWHGARSTPREDILADFVARLEGADWVVLYGHPCYEGMHEELLRSVFRAVLERGFRFATHRELSEQLRLGALH